MNYSFIIPVYNCKEFLPACVDSIRAAGAESYEILLIDDGSRDGSGELCDRLAERYAEVRAVHQANAGASAARNRGIREASGTYILFVDADDGLSSALLGEILSDPRCHGADMTIFGLTFDYYHNGKCYRRDPLFFGQDGILDRGAWTEAFEALYEKNSLSPVWNKVFRRELLMESGLELNTGMFLYEDLEFVLRYLAHCETIWNVPKAVYHYRQSEDEGNAKRRLARIDSISEFLSPIEGALDGLSDVPKEQKDTVLLRLHQVLAREKISTADLSGVKGICEDYARWCRERDLSDPENPFHQRLMEGKAAALLLSDRKTALRHWVAVRVKAMMRRIGL